MDRIRSFSIICEDSNALERLSRWCRDIHTHYYLIENRYSPESTIIRGKAFIKFGIFVQKINE